MSASLGPHNPRVCIVCSFKRWFLQFRKSGMRIPTHVERKEKMLVPDVCVRRATTQSPLAITPHHNFSEYDFVLFLKLRVRTYTVTIVFIEYWVIPGKVEYTEYIIYITPPSQKNSPVSGSFWSNSVSFSPFNVQFGYNSVSETQLSSCLSVVVCVALLFFTLKIDPLDIWKYSFKFLLLNHCKDKTP